MKYFLEIALAIIFAGALMLMAVPARAVTTNNAGVPHVLYIFVIDPNTSQYITINSTIFPSVEACANAGNLIVINSGSWTKSRVGSWCIPQYLIVID